MGSFKVPAICRLLANSCSWTVTWSFVAVSVGSWTTPSLSPERMPCARRPGSVSPQRWALARLRSAPSGSLRVLSRGERVHRQRAGSVVDSGTATRVLRRSSRPVLVSIVLGRRVDRVMRHVTRLRCPC